MMEVIVGQPPPTAQEYFSPKKSPDLLHLAPSSSRREEGESSSRLFSSKNIPEQSEIPPVEDLEWEKLTAEELVAMAATQSLLGGARTFRLDGMLTGARAEEFLKTAAALAASPHRFICREEKLLKKPADLLVKAGAVITSYAPVKREESFNIFSLANALASRDRKQLWLLYQTALAAGAAPEAVAGMLHWKVRDLAKGSPRAFTRAELAALSRRLVCCYHDAHRGAGELSLLLERLILSL